MPLSSVFAFVLQTLKDIVIFILQADFSGLYMSVNATLTAKTHTDLFVMSKTNSIRTVSHNVFLLYTCVCICGYMNIYIIVSMCVLIR